MAIRVLIVDDSGFFRRRVSEILKTDPQIQVVGTADNGREAVDKNLELKPDVITMDYEMPVMDGITALVKIMETHPTPVLMFSSLTHEGARVTLDALEAGAVDYLPKNFEDISRNSAELRKTLCDRVKAVARSHIQGKSIVAEPAASPAPAAPAAPKTSAPPPPTAAKPKKIIHDLASNEAVAGKVVTFNRGSARHKLVAIGTSTGGPVALQKVLTALPGNFPAPILLIQHMPGTFTKAFAERLHRLCQINVKEAEDGDQLKPGVALLAPGGKQLMVDSRGGGTVRVLAGDERLNYKPCVDVTFGSAAKAFGDKVLAVVLTGMGADGREGARMLKAKGSKVWAQDRESCVIFGMPMAIINANLADEVVGLESLSQRLVEAI
ncbi:chemotaxis response regulator protein-glutamate methylesterase [Endozoicomonas sp. SM1973]|uniref:Protein-glutamate methylesterase/protein-glutamine glutaminase n=1 Tax=Spartinivicinus marinus TaxID=2994442 RepID=A0A853I5Q9_9GAMM|nr:chemotaxis response regulator protein-glutamate methylesterase [Spartinivicinus marinus]NYZ65474.1 chemotaxis response regulator protein-glutamate methylesterase [Spartinivicinus marinus]